MYSFSRFTKAITISFTVITSSFCFQTVYVHQWFALLRSRQSSWSALCIRLEVFRFHNFHHVTMNSVQTDTQVFLLTLSLTTACNTHNRSINWNLQCCKRKTFESCCTAVLSALFVSSQISHMFKIDASVDKNRTTVVATFILFSIYMYYSYESHFPLYVSLWTSCVNSTPLVWVFTDKRNTRCPSTQEAHGHMAFVLVGPGHMLPYTWLLQLPLQP